jgi:hypothetical protein
MPDLASDFQPGELGQTDVQKEEVGPVLLGEDQGRLPIDRLGDDLDPGRRGEVGAKTLPRGRLVFGDEGADPGRVQATSGTPSSGSSRLT